jgi:hypothetical protein
VASAAGAVGDEIERVAQQMVFEKAIRLDRAHAILKANKEEKNVTTDSADEHR